MLNLLNGQSDIVVIKDRLVFDTMQLQFTASVVDTDGKFITGISIKIDLERNIINTDNKLACRCQRHRWWSICRRCQQGKCILSFEHFLRVYENNLNDANEIIGSTVENDSQKMLFSNFSCEFCSSKIWTDFSCCRLTSKRQQRLNMCHID